MSLLVLTQDWTLVDRLQYWFESYAAKRQIIWKQKATGLNTESMRIDLVLFDSRLECRLSDFPQIQQLLEQHPAIWLENPGDQDSPVSLKPQHGYVLGLDQITQRDLIRARERAIGRFAQQTAGQHSDRELNSRVSRLLQRWLEPIESEVSGLRQTLGWLRVSPQSEGDFTPSSRRSYRTEVTALRRRTDQLSHQLNKVRDLCSLLGKRFSTVRAPFCLPTMVREVIAKHPGVQLELDLANYSDAPEASLCFADAGQIRCSLEEVLDAFQGTRHETTKRRVELTRDPSNGCFRIAIFDQDPLGKNCLPLLRTQEQNRSWSITQAEPDYLLGLGLTRERIRHNGGDLGVIHDMGKGSGLELTIPSNELKSVLESYQRLLLNKLPDANNATIFTAKVPWEFASQNVTTLISQFLQSRLGSLGVAIPLEFHHWAVVAPIEANERDEFHHWLEAEWQTFLESDASESEVSLRFVDLEFSSLATVTLETEVAEWTELIAHWQTLSHQHQVASMRDGVRNDNKRLREVSQDLPALGSTSLHVPIRPVEETVAI